MSLENILFQLGVVAIAIVGICMIVWGCFYFVLKREQEQLARLGRFCENPVCIHYNSPVNKDGYVICESWKIFTHVVQSQNGKSIRLCDRCRSAVELINLTT